MQTLVSIKEATQNFLKVTRLVDEDGTAVVLKNNVPRNLVIDFSKVEKDMTASNEDTLEVSKRLIEQGSIWGVLRIQMQKNNQE